MIVRSAGIDRGRFLPGFRRPSARRLRWPVGHGRWI
jgi:hypothetical protein